MDEFFHNQGLWRKPAAKDGSCLFRAVSEQIFLCQAYHTEVRQSCVDFILRHRQSYEEFLDTASDKSFEQYIERLRRPNEWAGHIEICALSLLYRHDFYIFQEVGKPPVNVTENNFDKSVLLCYSGGNHYESVYTLAKLSSLAICQSIVYDVLYRNVFNMEPALMEVGIQMVRNKGHKSNSPNSKHLVLETDSEMKGSDSNKAYDSPHPPFPYRVAKALDPAIFRNAEFDSWLELKKDQQQNKEYKSYGCDSASVMEGDKCQVTLAGHGERVFNGHVQEICGSDNTGPVTVFIEELGEKHIIPHCEVKVIAGVRVKKRKDSANARGGYRKPSFSPGHHAHLRTPPRFTQGLINSCGQPVKKYWKTEGFRWRFRMGEQLPVYPFFPATPPECFEFQPSYRNEEYSGEYCSQIMEDLTIRDTCNRDMMVPSDDCGPCDNGQNHTVQINSMPPAPEPQNIQVVPSMPEQQPLITVPNGTLAPASGQLIVPFSDNLPGPVNFNIEPSRDTNGRDLPLSDPATLRYFFNLGCHYYRMSGACPIHVISTPQPQPQPQLQPHPMPPQFFNRGPFIQEKPPMCQGVSYPGAGVVPSSPALDHGQAGQQCPEGQGQGQSQGQGQANRPIGPQVLFSPIPGQSYVGPVGYLAYQPISHPCFLYGPPQEPHNRSTN